MCVSELYFPGKKRQPPRHNQSEKKESRKEEMVTKGSRQMEWIILVHAHVCERTSKLEQKNRGA